MAEKKKSTNKPNVKIDRAPTLNERITDMSKGSTIGKPIWGPARGKKK